MEIQKDFRELLELFNEHSVEYVIVGAYALAFHGAPRYTGDIDIYIHPSSRNARSVVSALTAFGFGDAGIAEEDFEESDRIVQLGYTPVRIDLITSLSGLSWEEVYAGKVPGTYGDVPVSYIGRKQLVANKRTSGRKKDIADLEALGED